MPTPDELARETANLRGAVTALTNELSQVAGALGLLLRAIADGASDDTLERLRGALTHLAHSSDESQLARALLAGLDHRRQTPGEPPGKPHLKLVPDQPPDES